MGNEKFALLALLVWRSQRDESFRDSVLPFPVLRLRLLPLGSAHNECQASDITKARAFA